jgi:ABC-type dipeptide/oligopeptide/nickel transport system ATPase component
VDSLYLKVFENEIVGLIGESGAGKTVTALAVLRLLPSEANFISGEILFRKNNLIDLTESEMRRLRGAEIGLVLQDPRSALNPLMRIDEQMSEGMSYRGRKAWKTSGELLDKVGIPDPERCLKAYPHQLSGGMRQRVLIAAALACEPSLLICDEITSSVDSIVRSQLLALLNRLRKEEDVSILLITHNLMAVQQFANRVYVLVKGKVVEEGKTEEVFKEPSHPFTRSLISSAPTLELR